MWTHLRSTCLHRLAYIGSPMSSQPGSQTLLPWSPSDPSLRSPDSGRGPIRSFLDPNNSHILPLRFFLSRPLHRVYLSDEPIDYDFSLLSTAFALVYAYGLGWPAPLWVALRYYGLGEWNVVEAIAVWRYGQFVWIPVSVRRPPSNVQYRGFDVSRSTA